MLTLARFGELAGSYGADMRRWPRQVRADAQALLAVSAEARRALEDARILDEALRAADRAFVMPPADQAGAFARLQVAVRTRIALPDPSLRGNSRFSWASMFDRRAVFSLRWLGATAGGTLAVIAGLVIGTAYAPSPVGSDILTMLQPVPIHTSAGPYDG